MDRSKPIEKSRLGRGLSALIPPMPAAGSSPGDERDGAAASAGAQEIALSAIVPNTLQPRTEFEAGALDDLTQSITAHGVLQPIMVRPLGPRRYELVAGERRFRAAEAAGLKSIPAVVREMTDEESLTIALIENIQREDLNAIEAARGYRQLIDQFGMTQASLAKQIGKAQPTIANALRLLKLSIEMQDSISNGQMTEEHGKALLSVADEDRRVSIWRTVIQRQLSVADTRKLALDASIGTHVATAPRRGPVSKDIHWVALEDRLRSCLGMKVGLRPAVGGGGTLTIQFTDPDEIEGILERLQP